MENRFRTLPRLKIEIETSKNALSEQDVKKIIGSKSIEANEILNSIWSEQRK